MSSPSGSVGKNQIRKWLDSQILSTIEEVKPKGNELYRIEVVAAGSQITITETENYTPIVIGGRIDFPSGVRSVFSDLDRRSRDLQNRIEYVLATTHGHYAYINEKDDITNDFQETWAIEIQHFIYPDGANQDRFMNSILNMSSRVKFIRHTIELLISELEDSR